MRIHNMPGKWERFDELARVAADERMAYQLLLRGYDFMFGTALQRHDRLSSGACNSWDELSKRTLREQLHKAQEAEDKAILHRPHRTHTRTAWQRLRNIIATHGTTQENAQ